MAINGGAPVREFPLIATPYQYSEQDAGRVARVVRTGDLTHDRGDNITGLEREFAQAIGSEFALSTNSGTSALTMACQSVGLHNGDEVILPAYTFVASAQAVLASRATPIFADIDNTFTINPQSITHLITKKTRAIMVVHMFGNVADMDKIMRIARAHNLAVIEDCAQAVGARYNGRDVGTFGDIGCYSFNIKKAIPTGQGGMFVTSNSQYYRRAMAIRNTGIEVTDGHVDVVSLGGTYFMTEMEAVLARSVLRQLTGLNALRRKNYEYLMGLIEPISDTLTPYRILSHAEPSYSRLSFLLHLPRLQCTREQFIAAVVAEGAPLKTFYPMPLYCYSLFQNMNGRTYVRQSFAEQFYMRHVGMEFSPYWSFSDMRDIATIVTNVIRHYLKSSHKERRQ